MGPSGTSRLFSTVVCLRIFLVVLSPCLMACGHCTSRPLDRLVTKNILDAGGTVIREAVLSR